MVEIPEHLLKRSKEARTKSSDAEPASEDAQPATPAAEEKQEAAAAPPPPPATPAPIAAEPAPREITLAEAKALIGPSIDLEGVGEEAYPEAELAEVAAGIKEVTTSKTPRWLVLAMLILPIVAVVYIGQFSNGVRCGQAGKLDVGSDGQMVDCKGQALPSPGGGGQAQGPDGKALFAANCASCHGATGGGGVGRPLSKDSNTTLLSDFPDGAQQVDFVTKGNQAFPSGWGAAKNPPRGVMPSFGKQLQPAEIEAIVKYERSLAGG